MPLCPAIAYPHHVIDPALDDPTRDDGERLLRKLRPMWRSVARGDNAYLLDPDATGSIAQLVAGDATGKAKIIPALIESAEDVAKPMIRLVAPSTGLLHPEVMDETMTTEERSATIPLQGDRRCAVIGDMWPVEMRPQPKIVIVFKKEDFDTSARHNAEMEITHVGTKVEVAIHSFSGSRKRLTATVADVRMLERAFDPADMALTVDREMIPQLPNDLPASL